MYITRCHHVVLLRFIYKPYFIYVPIHLQTRVKGELDKMIHLGVIEESIYQTEWCCPMIVAMKSQGRIRDMHITKLKSCTLWPL